MDPPLPCAVAALATFALASAQQPFDADAALDAADVVWTTPSKDSSGAMPIGNGEVGAMVWFAPDGVLHLLLSRTDSFSEASRLLKLGEVRVRMRAPAVGEAFAQRLHLRDGAITIAYGAGTAPATLRVFVDCGSDVVFVEGENVAPVTIECDSWRRTPRRLRGDELQSSWTMRDAPDDVVVTESADERVSVPVGFTTEDAVGWRHHDATSVVAMTTARQGLDPAAVPDPLLRRTFGLVCSCPDSTAPDADASAPATLQAPRRFALRIAAPCLQVEKAAHEWDERVWTMVGGADPAKARARTVEWWREFWQRSWVFADAGGAAADSAAKTSRLSQALALQRWIQACGGRGNFPIKFNGSIFTVEPKATGGQPFDADWRRWGDCFWWQNTRLPYYPMLAQGDFDMQAPLFRLYRDTLPVAEQRVQRWYGGKVRGAYWPETMTPFGTHANGDYGWQRKDLPANKVLCPWWEFARNQGLELLALMLDRFDYERDPAFVRNELLPIAVPVLAWFATAYPREPDGTLRIEPTQSIETYWHGVVDDAPTVAGLHCVLDRLLGLPAQLPADVAHELPLDDWRALRKALPPIPVLEQDGERMLAPAAAFDSKRSNCESPELYAVFPFRCYGLGRPGLDLARAAYAHRKDRFTNGWPQDGQDAALLGFVDDAAANVLAKLQNQNAAHRFPAMWGPNFDWLPDQCHGSNLLDTVHRMLLQCDGDTTAVLPCWPRGWDVSFRLHASRRTQVECEYRHGRIERLVVTPPERARDVIAPREAR